MKATLIFFSICMSLCAHAQIIDPYKNVVDSLIDLQQYDPLIQYLEKELIAHPGSEHLLRSLGFTYLEKKAPEQAELYYLKALSINANCAWCYLNLSRASVLKKNFQEALQLVDKAIEIDPTEGYFYLKKGQICFQLQDKLNASANFDKAIAIAPKIAEYYANRAVLNVDLNYPRLAIADMNRAINLEPDNVELYLQRARIYLLQNKYMEALQDLDKGISLDSTLYSLYAERSGVHHAMKNYSKAVVDLSKTIVLKADFYQAYLNRASANYALENLDAVCKDVMFLKKAIADSKVTDKEWIEETHSLSEDICDPSLPSYYYQRGIGLYNLEKYDWAINMYDQGLKLFPTHAMMLSFKANALTALNEYEKAITVYELAIKNQSNLLTEVKNNVRFAAMSEQDIQDFYHGFIADIYLNLSTCLAHGGQWESVLAHINKGIASTQQGKVPDKEAYFNLRGCALLNLKQYDKAMTDFNQSIDLNRNFVLPYVNRAITLALMEDAVKLKKFYLQGGYQTQMMHAEWTIPLELTTNSAAKARLTSAISDCDKAIQLAPETALAYYIRGQLKMMLKQPDYCMDLRSAQSKGLVVDNVLLTGCNY